MFTLILNVRKESHVVNISGRQVAILTLATWMDVFLPSIAVSITVNLREEVEPQPIHIELTSHAQTKLQML